MHSSDGTAAFLPTPTQELLLKACLFEGDEATAAWRAWRAATSLDNIDAGSVRLLPMLAQNMRQLAVEEPAFGKYIDVQRRTWARNQLLIRGAALASQHLLDARIPTMVLKGIVLVSRCYNGLSLRPMGDVDLLVPRNDAPRAIDVMQLHGWRVRHGGSRPHRSCRFRHYACPHDRAPGKSRDFSWTFTGGCSGRALATRRKRSCGDGQLVRNQRRRAFGTERSGHACPYLCSRRTLERPAPGSLGR